MTTAVVVVVMVVLLLLLLLIQFNSCLFACKLNSSDANYKVSTRT
jgi:hypothetical protein